MTGKPDFLRLPTITVCVVMIGLLAGCHLPSTESQPSPLAVGPVDVRTGYAVSAIVPLPLTPSASKTPVSVQPRPIETTNEAATGVARAAAPVVAPSVNEEHPKQKADALLASTSEPAETQWVSASPLGSSIPTELTKQLPRLRAPILIREDGDPALLPPAVRPADLPAIPTLPGEGPVSPLTQEPPIRSTPPRFLPLAGVPVPPQANAQPISTPPATLPPLPGTAPVVAPGVTAPAGPIIVGGQPFAFDALAKLVDANGGGSGGGGCSTCGGDCGPGRPCAPGAQKCEPFPTNNAFTRFVGIVYEIALCPDPCYQPKWEPIADSSFFVDSPRPVSNTRFQWDYGNHLAYPDRGEYFFARGDGSGKGPTAMDGLKGIPYLNYHQLTLVTEIASGPASVAVAIPYRSWDAEPYATSGAGFSDMSITAKTLLVDTELFMFAMQMQTTMPVGNPLKGLGDGHVSLEPGMIFGLRLTPDTYVQAEVQEWIPLGGDTNYAGAMLEWGLSVNHLLWQPVKDVQLIGTLEVTGFSYQAGEYTDPVLGPQKLSGENNVAIGNGYRLFFGNKIDFGISGDFGITGKYVVRDQMRFIVRFRY